MREPNTGVFDEDYGLCECGCGARTTVSRKTDKSKGWVKGRPLRFRKGHAVLGRTISGSPTYSFHRLSELELGWVAGLLEGEGCFTMKKGKRKNGFSYTPAVRVVSTDGDIIISSTNWYRLGASASRPVRRREASKSIHGPSKTLKQL